MFVYVQDYKGRMLFFDAHTGELFLINASAVQKALECDTHHPVHPELKMFDFVSHLPDEIFNVIKADTELKLNEKEPDILNLF